MSIRSREVGRIWRIVAAGLVLACAGTPNVLAAPPAAVPDRAPPPATWSAASPGSFARSTLLGQVMRPTTVGRVGRGSWWGGPVVTGTGETVTIYVSDRFEQNESVRLSWANFFAWLYHGSELSRVTIYQAPLDEVREICGPEAAGCYSSSRQILVFPGDAGAGADADIGAHEYGHHVAANRRNDPWDANDWGPKHWATVVGVCSRVAAGTAFPGDEGDRYTLNSGEAWAEAYRFLNIQRGGGPWANFPLLVDPSFAPTGDSLASALTDVQQPWPGPAATSWDGGFVAPLVSLHAAVGPRASISLKTAAGAPVRALATGPYAITVRDLSASDNFHLIGSQGLDRKTGVVGRGRVVWRVALKPGTYRFRSDAHPTLRGSFTVGRPAVETFPPQEKSITTLLDGDFLAAISGTANATLELVDPATGQTLGGATPGSAPFSICGRRAVLLRVAATKAGTFHVAITTP